MPSILHYPNYSPSRHQLRALLLYYDKVHSIVPWVDQHHVESREHVQEVLENDAGIFDCIDPSEGFGAWVDSIEEMQAFKNIISKVKEKNDSISQTIEKKYKAPNSLPAYNDQGELMGVMHQHGWTIVALQKIPPRWIDFMHHENAALKLGMAINPETGLVIEENPVLMPKIVADFLLSQLARTISHTRGVSNTSYSERSVVNQLYDPRVEKMQMRTDLLTLTLPLVIPEDLEQLRIGDYIELRESNATVRNSLNELLESLVLKYDLDSAADALQFNERVSDAVDKIAKQVAVAEKQQSIRKFSRPVVLCIDFFATVGGAALGEVVGGGAGGAATGAALGLLGAKASKSLSTLGHQNDNNLIESLACTRSRIIQDVRRSKLTRPNYMV